jgi:site-specific DNA-methyltransferase (adenine-specific)
VHDTILVYSKGPSFILRPLLAPADRAKMPHTLITGSDGLKYQTFELTAPGRTKAGQSGRPWKGVELPDDRHWANDHATMDDWDAGGLIHWPRNGGFPRRRAEEPFDEASRTVTVGDVWTDIDRIN